MPTPTVKWSSAMRSGPTVRVMVTVRVSVRVSVRVRFRVRVS